VGTAVGKRLTIDNRDNYRVTAVFENLPSSRRSGTTFCFPGMIS
jgi:hypothetical protein